MVKWVYTFGAGEAEGSSDMRDLLGGKGAGLAEMANLGLPVPPGFTITTEVCAYFYENERAFPPELAADVETALGHIGRADRQAPSATMQAPLLSRCARARARRCPA